MDAGVVSFTESLVVFCKSVLEIPIKLYTLGLEVCPWVFEFIMEIKVEHGIDILGVIPELQNIIQELDNILKVIGV